MNEEQNPQIQFITQRGGRWSALDKIASFRDNVILQCSTDPSP